jgi:xylulokinase
MRSGHGYKEYDCSSPQPGWIEQDLEAVWNGICSASKQAVAQANLPPQAYHSLGLSSQRGTFALLDENKDPLAKSIVWNCGRALKCEEQLAAAFPGEGEHQVHTGMQISPLWTAAKIIWLREKRPEIFAKTRWFANGQEYFLHRMGADDWSTDPASLTLNGMMDIAKLDWSDRILSVCGIDRDRLPPVGIPSARAGRLSRKAAEETGPARGPDPLSWRG